MQAYLDLLKKVMETGEDRPDRTGVGVRSIFGHQMRFDLSEGFPALTTKKLHLRSIWAELLWFLKGDTHVSGLHDYKVKIWDPWATAEECAKFGRQEGELGPIYGHQWRNFGATQLPDGTFQKDGVDQIQNIIDTIKTNPYSRRLIVTGWNPKEATNVTLPPCHTLFQFYVSTDKKLSCQLYQRSADIFLGLPFNIASYSLLTHLIAATCGLGVGDFVHTIGDAHLYLNHLEQATLQLSREPLPLPQLVIEPPIASITDWTPKQIRLENYEAHPHIKAEVAV